MHHLFGLCIHGSSGLPPSQGIGGRPKKRGRLRDFTTPPPSANQDSWRRGSNFSRDMQIFRLSSHHLAEGGQITEKNARSLAAALELLPDWGYTVQFILAI